MKIPVQAFAEMHPKDVSPGSVLKFRGSWAMLVGYEDSRKDLLMLAGERAGFLIGLGDGMGKCLAIIAPFSWFPAVDEGVEPVTVDYQATTLTLTDNGPVIIGSDMDRYDPDHRAFGMNGLCDRKYKAYGSGLRFGQWSAQLAHEDEPFKSLGQLFEVIGPPVAS
ncbi:MAG: hypothetical protein ABI114_10300 [Rhodanobacter sp.]